MENWFDTFEVASFEARILAEEKEGAVIGVCEHEGGYLMLPYEQLPGKPLYVYVQTTIPTITGFRHSRRLGLGLDIQQQAVVFLNIIKRPDDAGELSTFEEEEARWSFSFARMVLQFFQQFLPKEG